MSNTAIDVRRLESQFRAHAGVVTSLSGIDLRINDAEPLCLVSEFGSGKSVTAHFIMRLLPATGDIVQIN